VKNKQYCHSGKLQHTDKNITNGGLLVAPMQHYLLVWPGNLCIIYQIMF